MPTRYVGEIAECEMSSGMLILQFERESKVTYIFTLKYSSALSETRGVSALWEETFNIPHSNDLFTIYILFLRIRSASFRGFTMT